MNLTVNRTKKAWDGVFGEIPELNLKTLEHAYQVKGPDGRLTGSFDAKVPKGTYTCVRGKHTLPNGEEIETFEVLNVPGHTGILFHPGNKYQDSAGCFLVGIDVVCVGHQNMITTSRLAFHEFMDAQQDVDQFVLTVNDPQV
jgi:hypothetical protein